MRIDLLKRAAVTLLGVIVALAAAAYLVVAAALPRRDGEARVAGLSAPLTVELDARAVPRLQAASFEDALRGEGYMHAQERFFAMDLFRRSTAGELAALVGEGALRLDEAQAPFDFRARARALLAELPDEQRGWLAAYTQGVNAGLADLGARPPEYWLLGAKPEPWLEEDSLLVVFGFYTRLSNNESYERPQLVMHEVLPEPVYALLTPSTTRFDRPQLGADADVTGGYVPVPIPGPQTMDLRGSAAPALRDTAPRVVLPLAGPASNQWALDGTRTARGDALLGNDPHLDVRVPNTFYRVELTWPGGAARGVSIPGLPGVLIGGSDALAWGATVSNADQSDWVIVDVDPADDHRYLVPGGSEAFRVEQRQIAVAGGAAQPFEWRATRWGPVVAHDHRGRPLALHATWLEPGGLNLDIIGLVKAASVADGVAIVERWAGPSLNWMLADADGGIGWAVNGPLPRRVGFDGSRPESLGNDSRAWQGELARPQRIGGRDGALFTANSRTVPNDDAAPSRVWMSANRAFRIADLLAARKPLTERDSLAMQLDTRVAAYDFFRDVVLEVVPPDDTEPLLVRAREHVAAWNGRADVDQVGYRILHVYYRTLLQRVLTPLLHAAIEADPDFVYRWPLADEPLRRVLEERPAHLLTREHADWPSFLRQVLLDTLRDLDDDPARPDSGATWGEVNVLDVAHPFAALPAIGGVLGPWLRYPRVPLPGATSSLRVATPDYGALLRMSVSPAHPEDGILELAGGQSGHFLSANFADLQADWVDGAPTPFLAGPAVSKILLTPVR